jgi:hypothetical protein
MVSRQQSTGRSALKSQVPEYEIRLHHADGSLSVVMMVTAIGDADAKAQATKMLEDGLANAHIWRDGRLVDSIYRI